MEHEGAMLLVDENYILDYVLCLWQEPEVKTFAT